MNNNLYRISKKKLFATSFVSAGLLPFVPDATDAFSIFFALTFTLLILSFIPRLLSSIKICALDMSMIVFVIYCAMTIFWKDSKISLYEWFRAFIPFLFLASVVIFRNLSFFRNKLYVYNIAIVCCSVWLIKLVVLHVDDIFKVIFGDTARLSYLVTDTLVPFGLTGFILTLFWESKKKWLKYLLLAGFFSEILLAGYRSHILLAFFGFLYWIKFCPIKYSRILLVVVPIILSAVLMLSITKLNFVEKAYTRFTSMGEEKEGLRALEIAYAYQSFLEAPIIGNGLGYPVPIYLFRTEAMQEESAKDFVGYIHNLLFYVLMDLGIIGLLLLIIITLLFITTIKSTKIMHKAGWCHSGMMVALAMLGLFFFVSASFRQIQTLLIFSMLLVSLTGTHKDSRSREIHNH